MIRDGRVARSTPPNPKELRKVPRSTLSDVERLSGVFPVLPKPRWALSKAGSNPAVFGQSRVPPSPSPVSQNQQLTSKLRAKSQKQSSYR